jgi:heme/copper-type cytochrome/quinol oxidase subunit 3
MALRIVGKEKSMKKLVFALIFMAISVGLGLISGYDQTSTAVTAGVMFLVFMGIMFIGLEIAAFLKRIFRGSKTAVNRDELPLAEPTESTGSTT